MLRLLGTWFATGFNRGDPVETDLQKLISEYCAIEKMDRTLRGSAQNNETELIGLAARENRRREILLEIAALTSVAEDPAKQAIIVRFLGLGLGSPWHSFP
jgi:hypothetical protein